MASKLRAFDLSIMLVPVSVLLGALWLLASIPHASRPPDLSLAPATAWLRLDDAKPLERIGFGSCLDQADPQPIWNAVIRARPQAFLMMGDTVYGDVKDLHDPAIPEMRQAYRVQARQPELARARASFPFLAIWDDHDFGVNDAGGDFPLKQSTRAAFREFWQMQEPLAHEGLYYSRIVGPAGKRVQLIFLDNRWFRSQWKRKSPLVRATSAVRGPYDLDDDPEKTMLGAEQWAWLEKELQKPAEIRLLVSSIQIIADAHSFERWGNFPKERDRLYALLQRSNARGLLLLTGDRHWAAAYRKGGVLPYPLIEVTSSALNKRAPDVDAPELARISEAYNAPNFGLIEIDWVARRLKATVSGVTQANVIAVDVPFAELGL